MQPTPAHRIAAGDITVWPQGPPDATDDLQPDGGFGYLNEQVLWFQHDAMPDSRSALRIPEGISWAAKQRVDAHTAQSHNYQIGQQWTAHNGTLRYDNCPISAPRGPSPGTISATVCGHQHDLMRVRMTIVNTSDRPLEAVTSHLCFNHRRAPLLGRHIFAASTDGWVDFNQYVDSEPFRGYNFNAQTRPKHLPAITHPILISETIHPHAGSFASAIGSASACSIMSNIEWPCTDLNVDFGAIAPKQTSTRDIFIGIGPGTKEQWFKTLQRNFSAPPDTPDVPVTRNDK